MKCTIVFVHKTEITRFALARKSQRKKEVVKEVVHDTVYVVVDKHKKDTISMPLDRAECILQCQKDNVSKSLVDFCIKDKCK